MLASRCVQTACLSKHFSNQLVHMTLPWTCTQLFNVTTYCKCVTDWVIGILMHVPSATDASGNTGICKHEMTKAHDIAQQSRNDGRCSDSPQVDYPRWCILLQILQQQVSHVEGSKVINAHGNLKIFLGSVIRWYEHPCRNRASLLKREIFVLKSGKCDEYARTGAVYRKKRNVQKELDSVRQAFIEAA